MSGSHSSQKLLSPYALTAPSLKSTSMQVPVPRDSKVISKFLGSSFEVINWKSSIWITFTWVDRKCSTKQQRIKSVCYLSNYLKCEIVCVHFVQKSFILTEEEVLCNYRDIMPTLVRKVEGYSKLVARKFVRHIENPERELLTCKLVLRQPWLLFYPTSSPLVVLMTSMVSTVAFS